MAYTMMAIGVILYRMGTSHVNDRHLGRRARCSPDVGSAQIIGARGRPHSNGRYPRRRSSAAMRSFRLFRNERPTA